jgi:hypothetical protein
LLWTTNERVNNDLGTTQQDRPDITLDGAGNAYFVWLDQRNGNFDINFSYRPPSGSWVLLILGTGKYRSKFRISEIDR